MKPALLLLSLCSLALAHDTWIQTNTNLVRVGDAVSVDLMLGNHGNDHRDFKIAGKVDPEKVTLHVVAPDGSKRDLKPDLRDIGTAAKEGYYNAMVAADRAGLYSLVQTSDQVVAYAPTRSIKSAKAFFVASRSLDRPPTDNPGHDRVFGHALELVPLTNPVTPMGKGTPMKLKLLFKGSPLPDAKVSFIPRGVTLKEGYDARYERTTDADGIVVYEPAEANLYLIVAHHADSAAGDGYTSTKYSATVTLWVPAICACCGE
jgi:uncharacterized GH25 family protein